jgi:hypothetical protein
VTYGRLTGRRQKTIATRVFAFGQFSPARRLAAPAKLLTAIVF